MASSRLAASILVNLVDKASGPAGKIAKGLRSIQSAVKMSGKNKFDLGVNTSTAKNLDKISISARRMARDLRAIGKVDIRVSSSGLNSFRIASSQARTLTRDLRSAASAAKSINLSLVGRGSGSPFGAMRRDINAMMRDMRKLQSMSRGIGRGGGGGGLGGGGGGYVPHRRRGGSYANDYVAIRAAEGTVRGGRRAAAFAGRAGADAMREESRDYLAGLKPEDTERLHKKAADLSSKYRSVDQTTLHEMLRDTSMSMGSVDKGVENGENLAQMATVIQSMKGPEKAIENVRKFYSALDVLGKNVDPAQIKRLSNAYTKAQGVEGEEMDMGKLLSFARQARSAGGALSDDFLMYAAPALMQDLGGPQSGTALASGLSQVIGGRATKESMAAQQAIGLRRKDGSMSREDSNLFQENLQAYVQDKLMPAMAKGGSITIGKGKKQRKIDLAKVNLDDEREVNAVASQLYSNRMVADAVTKLINQREQYARKRQQYNAAPGQDAADGLTRKDAYVANKAVSSQTTNVAAEALRPYMDAYATAADKLSEMLGNLAKSMADNPAESKIATPLVTGVIGTIAAWLAGKGLQELGKNATGVVGNAARMGGNALVGGAGAATAVPLVAGTVGGAVLDNNVSSIGSRRTTLRNWRERVEQKKRAEQASAVFSSARGVGAFDRNKKMGTIGSALEGYSTDYTQSRDSVVDNFLRGAIRGSTVLPSFGFQGRGAPPQLPGQQAPLTPPQRPVELGGAPAAPNMTASTAIPVETDQQAKIAAATAEVSKYESELAKVKSQLDGLKASGQAAFSPETFTLESKVSELEAALDKAKAKLTEVGQVSVAPTVDTGSIKAAEAAADSLLAKLKQIGPAADAGAAAVGRAAANASAAAGSAARSVASLERSRQTALTSSPA